MSIKYKRKLAFDYYQFSVKELVRFAEGTGFEIIEKKNYCLKQPLYNVSQIPRHGINILRMLQPMVFPVLDFLEKTPVNLFAWGSLIIAIKPSSNPYCFFCGEVFDYKKSEAHDFLVPVCKKCRNDIPDKILSEYKKTINLIYEARDSYRFSKLQLNHLECKSKKERCFFCGKSFDTNKYISDYGFSVPTCQECLKDPLLNLELSNFHIKYAWFER